jgi:hypothetical protein
MDLWERAQPATRKLDPADPAELVAIPVAD